MFQFEPFWHIMTNLMVLNLFNLRWGSNDLLNTIKSKYYTNKRKYPNFGNTFVHNALQWNTPVTSRVSKSCNHAITRLRKIFQNLCKCWLNENETRNTKLGLISCICHNLQKGSFLLVLHASAQNFQPASFDCANKFALRNSGNIPVTLLSLECLLT